MAGSIPLILDVDTGIDDAFGLLYALRAAVRPPDRRRQRRRQRRSRQGDAQHARGARARRPRGHSGLAGLRRAAAARARGRERHSRRDRARLRRTARAAADPSPTHAIDAILAAARQHAGELVLVATGPLTNIAAALLRDPELPRRLKRFVLMGGAFRERRQRHASGGVQHLARSGSGAHRVSRLRRRRRGAARRRRPRRHAQDAAASSRSRRARATLRRPAARARVAALPRGFRALLFRADGKATRRAAVSSCTIRSRSPRRSIRRFIVTEPAAVDVEISGELTSGMTVADWRGVWKRAAQRRGRDRGRRPALHRGVSRRNGAAGARLSASNAARAL